MAECKNRRYLKSRKADLAMDHPASRGMFFDVSFCFCCLVCFFFRLKICVSLQKQKESSKAYPSKQIEESCADEKR